MHLAENIQHKHNSQYFPYQLTPKNSQLASLTKSIKLLQTSANHKKNQQPIYENSQISTNKFYSTSRIDKKTQKQSQKNPKKTSFDTYRPTKIIKKNYVKNSQKSLKTIVHFTSMQKSKSKSKDHFSTNFGLNKKKNKKNVNNSTVNHVALTSLQQIKIKVDAKQLKSADPIKTRNKQQKIKNFLLHKYDKKQFFSRNLHQKFGQIQKSKDFCIQQNKKKFEKKKSQKQIKICQSSYQLGRSDTISNNINNSDRRMVQELRKDCYSRKKKSKQIYFMNQSIQKDNKLKNNLMNQYTQIIEKYEDKISGVDVGLISFRDAIRNYLKQIEAFYRLGQELENEQQMRWKQMRLNSEWYFSEFYRRRCKFEKILIRLQQCVLKSKNRGNLDVLREVIKNLNEENRLMEGSVMRNSCYKHKGLKKYQIIKLLQREIGNIKKQQETSYELDRSKICLNIKNLYQCIQVMKLLKSNKLVSYLQDMFF